MLVRGVVIADNVQVNPGMGVGDLVQEVNKFNVRVLLVEDIGAEFPGQDIQCRKQGGGAVSFVVVGLLLRVP